MIMHCGCVGKAGVQYQDNAYGKGNRVFNLTAKADAKTYRCTLCGATKTKGGGEIAAPKGEKAKK